MKKTLVPVNAPLIGDYEKKFVSECMENGWISSAGKFVRQFEEQFSNYCGCAYGLTTTNGTTAIHLALKSLDIGLNDEVLVPSLTMAGSVYPIVQCRARPVFVDSEPETFNMDIDDLAKKITKKTKAILVVHLYGHPVDMDPVVALAKKHNIYIIEDAAEAHGALYRGQKVGSIGDIGCFSFFANKIITTGEGGMIVSNNKEIIAKAARLKDLAHEEIRFTHALPEAYNYRMTNMQAAIGLGQLLRIEEIIEQKIANAKLYNELLSTIDDLILPVCKPWARNVYWMYTLLLKKGSRLNKHDLMQKLADLGIETRSFFYPLNEQAAFAEYNKNDCPNAKSLSERGLYLPSGQALTTEQIHYVSSSLHELFLS